MNGDRRDIMCGGERREKTLSELKATVKKSMNEYRPVDQAAEKA